MIDSQKRFIIFFLFDEERPPPECSRLAEQVRQSLPKHKAWKMPDLHLEPTSVSGAPFAERRRKYSGLSRSFSSRKPALDIFTVFSILI